MKNDKDKKNNEDLINNNKFIKKKIVRGNSSIDIIWGISANIRNLFNNVESVPQKERLELYEDYTEPCYIYIFDIKDLEKIINIIFVINKFFIKSLFSFYQIKII